MTCARIHARVQPEPGEFKCPSCGSPRPDFHIDGDFDQAPDGCPQIHVDDLIVCDRCGYTRKGRTFTDGLALRRTVAREQSLR